MCVIIAMCQFQVHFSGLTGNYRLITEADAPGSHTYLLYTIANYLV